MRFADRLALLALKCLLVLLLLGLELGPKLAHNLEELLVLLLELRDGAEEDEVVRNDRLDVLGGARHRVVLELLVGRERWVLVPAEFLEERAELPAEVSELLFEELVLTHALLQLLAVLLRCGGERITFRQRL